MKSIFTLWTFISQKQYKKCLLTILYQESVLTHRFQIDWIECICITEPVCILILWFCKPIRFCTDQIQFRRILLLPFILTSWEQNLPVCIGSLSIETEGESKNVWQAVVEVGWLAILSCESGGSVTVALSILSTSYVGIYYCNTHTIKYNIIMNYLRKKKKQITRFSKKNFFMWLVVISFC